MTRLQVAIAAHVLLRRPDGSVLFQRRHGTGFADGHWSVPAGHVESGETFHQAAVRELREEVGVLITEADLQFGSVQQKLDLDGQERLDVFFWTDLPDGQQPRILEHDRCDGLQWAPPSAPPEPAVPYVRSALEQMPGPSLLYFGY